eukprot:6492802-Amphidinium_carterae.5
MTPIKKPAAFNKTMGQLAASIVQKACTGTEGAGTEGAGTEGPAIIKRPAGTANSAEQAGPAGTANSAEQAGPAKAISIEESKRWNSRMKCQLTKHPEAAAAWSKLCSLPARGSAKNARKRLFLFSWHENLEKERASFGPSFWIEQNSLITEETQKITGVWISIGRLSQLIGEEEAYERAYNNEFATKVDDYGRELYFYTEESMENKATKRRKAGTEMKKSIAPGERTMAEDRFDQLHLQDGSLDMLAPSKQHAAGKRGKQAMAKAKGAAKAKAKKQSRCRDAGSVYMGDIAGWSIVMTLLCIPYVVDIGRLLECVDTTELSRWVTVWQSIFGSST